jgi:ABC-type uncharacterized transport system auxiliary subunit
MIRKLILLIYTALLITGCLTRAPEATRYYLLDYPSDTEIDLPGNGPFNDKSCTITSVDVNPAYSSHQIAIREHSHEIKYFALNIWAVRPEQSLTNMMTEFFKNHKVFESVHLSTLNTETDFTLGATVYNLEVVQESRDYYARLNVEYQLKDHQSNQIVYDHRADKRVLLDDRNLNLFAAAISEIYVEELAKFVNTIIEEIR